MSGLHRRIVGAALGIALNVAATGAAAGAAGQPAGTAPDAVRGGWVADVGGTRHIFVLVVRDAAVTGIYCPVDCADPSRLALIDQGVLTPEGLRFRILWPGVAAHTDVIGRIDDGRLLLTMAPAPGRPEVPRQLSLQRDPRKPRPRTVEELFASRGVESGPLVIAGHSGTYTPPGPNEPLSAPVLEGLWVWSNGPARQHFIFRAVDDRMLGLACGPCDNPWTFGPIDNVVIRGDTVTFDIVHEDWGIGIEHGPYANHATATLSRHELHLRTEQHNGPRTIQGDLVLTGPLRTTPR